MSLVVCIPLLSTLGRMSKREINDSIPDVIASEALKAAKETGVADILVLGLTYKPDIGDFRESPSIALLRTLSGESGIHVFYHDPFMGDEAKRHVPDNARFVPLDDLNDKLASSIAIIATPHSFYDDMDFSGAVRCLDPSGFLLKKRVV